MPIPKFKPWKRYTVRLIGKVSDMNVSIEHLLATSPRQAKSLAVSYMGVPGLWLATAATQEPGDAK